jgi:hypothetical protein
MVARFIYRLFSLFFFVLALACWLLMAVSIHLQFMALGFDLQAFSTAILSAAMALWTHTFSNEAWRAARRLRHDPVWRDYP